MTPFILLALVYVQLFVLTFLIYLPYICKDWAYSPLFSGDEKLFQYVKTAVAINDKRYHDAQVFFATHEEPEGQPDPDTFPEPELVIGIITSKRVTDNEKKYNLGYITQSLAYVHKEAKEDYHFKNKVIIVCNVDNYPDDFTELLYLKKYAKIYNKYEQPTHPREEEEHFSDDFEKHKLDYMFCLEKAAKYSPKYALILEDDVLGEKQFLQTLHKHLATNLQLHYEMGNLSENKKWAFIKLFYPDKWRGYSNSIITIVEFCGIFITGGMVSAVVFHWVRIVLTRLRFNCIKTRNIYCLSFVYGGIYGVMICYCIGRVYVMDFLYHSTHSPRLITPAPGCCTQAILYPSHIINELTQYLSNIRCHIDFSHDLAIDEFAVKYDYSTFTVEPNMFQHIGMVSSIRAWAKNAAEYIFP